MVEERGYEARVRVQAGAALPGVSADSFGAGVGQALSQAGAVVQQERLEDARLDRELRDNREWSAYLVAEAQQRERWSTAVRDGRQSYAPGHAARIAEIVKRDEEDLLGSLTSKRLQVQARVRLAETGGSLRAREADWEYIRGQQKAVDNVELTLKYLDGEARRASSLLDYEKLVKSYRDGLLGLAISDDLKGKFDVEVQQRAAVGFVRGQIDRNPGGALNLLDTGFFDGVITGDQVEVLRNGAQVEIRALERKQKNEVAAQVATIKENLQVFKTAIGDGLVTAPEEFDGPIAQALAVGDRSLALELEGLKFDQRFVREWGPETATAFQREQRLATLAGRSDLSDTEKRELKFLRDNNSSWAAEEARDPVTQASRRGGAGAPPVIDLNDGATWDARARWMVTQGSDAAFRADEVRELQGLLDNPQGELEVLSRLDQVRDEVARSQMAEQLVPDDPTFKVMSVLAPADRARVRQGKKAMAANSKFFSDLDDGVKQGLADIDDRINLAMRGFDVDDRTGIRETVKQYLAGLAVKEGYNDFSAFKAGDSFDRMLRAATTRALGGTYITRGGKKYRLGGLGDWNGKPFVLPTTINEAEFKRRLQIKLRDTNDPPVNPDGTPANLFRAQPVAVPGGFYIWIGAGGKPIKTKSGVNYRVRLAQ